MLKSLFALMLLASSVAVQADEILLLNEKYPPRLRTYNHDLSFKMDPKSRMPAVHYLLSKTIFSPTSSGATVSVADERYIAVPGLIRVDDQLLFKSRTSEVLCGNFYASRVLRREKFSPTGDCKFNVVRTDSSLTASLKIIK